MQRYDLGHNVTRLDGMTLDELLKSEGIEGPVQSVRGYVRDPAHPSDEYHFTFIFQEDKIKVGVFCENREVDSKQYIKIKLQLRDILGVANLSEDLVPLSGNSLPPVVKAIKDIFDFYGVEDSLRSVVVDYRLNNSEA